MARFSTKQLAGICRRLGTGLEAGLDVRNAWRREAERGRGAHRTQLEHVADAVDRGEKISIAMSGEGRFPPLASEMVAVGEETGRLEQVLLQLADHYDHIVKLRRGFLFGIAWPAIQLGAAILIIGFLILILGAIGGPNADIMGFGVTGFPAMLLFFLIMGMFLGLLALPVVAVLRGWLGTFPQRVALELPLVGNCLRTTALARMAWSLSMANDAGMEVRRAVGLALRSTQLVFYTEQADAIDKVLLEGEEIHTALRRAEGWPDDFLDALETGETTGMVSESMARLAKDYGERANSSSGLIATLASIATWCLTAGILIFFIFRLAWVMYFKHIYDLTEGL